MTNEQINLKIAEYLEPEKYLPSINAFLFGPQIYGMPVIPPKFWKDNFELKQWQPRDFVNDPAMTVMLMHELLQADKCFFVGPDFFEVFPTTPGECEPDFEISLEVGFVIGPVMAEAFCRANGIWEGEGLTKDKGKT